MKPQHAAALALVGWYLAAPPITGDMKAIWINFKAPLNEWTITESFDSKEDCMQALRGRDHLAAEAGKRGDAQTKELWRQAYSKAECIAADDLLRDGGYIGRIR